MAPIFWCHNLPGCDAADPTRHDNSCPAGGYRAGYRAGIEAAANRFGPGLVRDEILRALAAPREDGQAPGATGTICVECGKRAMQPAVRVCSGCGAWTFNGDGARVLDEVKREDAEKRGGRCDACGGDGYTSGFRKCPACAGSGKQGGGTT